MRFYALLGHFKNSPKTGFFCPNEGAHLSIRTLDHAWNHSRHKGAELLLLLAIADIADDDLAAHTSVDSPGAENQNDRKASLTPASEAQRINRAGGLEVERERGRGQYICHYRWRPSGGVLGHCHE